MSSCEFAGNGFNAHVDFDGVMPSALVDSLSAGGGMPGMEAPSRIMLGSDVDLNHLANTLGSCVAINAIDATFVDPTIA